MGRGLCFAIGSIVGAAIGSVCSVFIVKDRYEKMANDDIEAMRIHNRKKIEDILNEILSEEEGKRLEKINKLKEKYSHKENIREDNSEKNVMKGRDIKRNERRTSYNSYCTDKGPERVTRYDITDDPGGPPEGDDSDSQVVVGKDETMSYELHKKNNNIELIDSIEYGEKDLCDEEEYFYYSGNDIVTNAFDKEVVDWEDFLGNAWIEELISNKDGVVYIRNNRISMKYQVTLIEGDYTDIS